MSDSIEELATQLDEFAVEQDEKSKTARPPISAGYRNEAKLLRAAALKLRECREALEPFATEAATYDADDDTDTDKLVPDSKMLIIESIDGTLSDSLISVGDFRRAAKTLEAK